MRILLIIARPVVLDLDFWRHISLIVRDATLYVVRDATRQPLLIHIVEIKCLLKIVSFIPLLLVDED